MGIFDGGGIGGGGPGSSLRFSQTRGRMQGGATSGLNYPSPFFDLAHTYYPATVKQLFRWCRYYFLTNPLINSTVFKLSEYPVTDMTFTHEDPAVVAHWTEYFQDYLGYRATQVESGLNYFSYGNDFCSISYPFKKFLTCTSCGHQEDASKIRSSWIFTNFKFHLSCPKCKVTADANVKDHFVQNSRAIKIVRWNPEDMEVSYNAISGRSTYFYTIPAAIRNDIVIGRKDVVEDIPQVYIQAMKEQKGIIFAEDNIFHLKRPSISTPDRGWGTPLLLPVLKDTFYLQIMKKTQEAILLEHLLPLRVLFPQPGDGTTSPWSTISMVDWRDHVAKEIARWRYDPSYIPLMPLPLGSQSIGGEGKGLMLTAEMQEQSKTILAGMGVPWEFIFGGLSYQGSQVSMRMVENGFIGYLIGQKQMARFVMRGVAKFMQWPEAGIQFKPFKAADDLQRKAYFLQLNAANKISDTTLLADSDLDQSKENEIMLAETDRRVEATKRQQLAMAEIQGEASIIMATYQGRAQAAQAAAMASAQQGSPTGSAPTPFGKAVQSPLSALQRMGDGAAVDMQSAATAEAQRLSMLSPSQQTIALQNMRGMSPEYADIVQGMIKKQRPEGSSEEGGVDTRPLPEQRAPRRDTAIV